MPRGGNNRKSRQLKIVHGTFRKDRNPAREPEPRSVAAIPKPPAGMNRWARKLWKSLAAELVDLMILTNVDLASLQLLCEAYGDYEEAKQALFRPVNPFTGKRMRRSLEQYLSGMDPWLPVKDIEPKDLIGMRRNSQTAPELAQRNKAWAIYKSYMIEFGLSPASRNRISLPEPTDGEEDKMERLYGAK